MNSTTTIVAAVFCVVLLLIFLRILRAPFKSVLKILLNMVTGFVILYLVNIVCGLFGYTIDITWFRALVAGVLGIPGVILILLFQFVL